MDRRAVLRYTALLTGGTIALPVATSLLSGCKFDPKVKGFVPKLFSADQYKMIQAICQTILPDGEIPGANEVGVSQLIDQMVNVTYSPKNRAKYVKGLQAMVKLWSAGEGKSFAEMTAEEQTIFLTNQQSAIKQRAEERLAAGIVEERVYTEVEDMAAPSDDIDAKVLTPEEEQLWADNTYNQLRQQTISYYLSSEEICTNYLNYLPVPGKYEPCITLEEAGGKAWAI